MRDSSEVKQLAATIVATDEDAGGWTAVASAPTLDRDGEKILSGAFEPLPASVPVHDGHRFDRIVGRARPYCRGGVLHVEGRFSSVPAAQEVRTLVQEGVLDSMSVVFHDPVRKTVDGVPTIVGGELLSVDFVSIPSNRDARVLSVRGRPGPGSVTDAAALIAQARMALLELDAMERPDDLLTKTHRIVAEASAVLDALDTRDACRSARQTVSEARHSCPISTAGGTDMPTPRKRLPPPEGAPLPPPNSTFGTRRRRLEEEGPTETPRHGGTPTMEAPPAIRRTASLRIGDETFEV